MVEGLREDKNKMNERLEMYKVQIYVCREKWNNWKWKSVAKVEMEKSLHS